MNRDSIYMMAGADADQLDKYADINTVEEFDPQAELAKLGIEPPEPLELTEELLEENRDSGEVRTICADPVTGQGDVFSVCGAIYNGPAIKIPNNPPVGYAKEKAEYEASGSTQGMRFNKGKVRYDLMPPEALDVFARIYTMGAEKYAPRNWEKGISVMGCWASILRHGFVWAAGQTLDEESGEHHMGHVMWNAAAIVTFYKRKMDDDRPVILPEE